MADKPKLTPKQEAFVREYTVDFNGQQAAIRAGYSPKCAAQQATRLLNYAQVIEAVEVIRAARAERTGITAERVLKEAEALAFSCIDHYRVTADGYLEPAPGAPPDCMRAVSSLKRKRVVVGKGDDAEGFWEVEFRLWNKPEVLKLAGKHAGVKGFADRLELTDGDGNPIAALLSRALGEAESKEAVH